MKRIIYILLTFNLQLATVFPQLVQQQWVARYPGPGRDLRGPFLAVDRNGSSYVAGTHVVNDTSNVLLIKYNSSGTQLWVTLYKFPGYGCFRPNGLALDTAGNPCIIGVPAIYPNCMSEDNLFTAKFNTANGSVLWMRRYIAIWSYSYPNDIKIDRLNNIYVTGSADSSALIIKYNQNGDTLWVRKYHPRPSLAGSGACTIDDSLNIITTGSVGQYFNWPPPGGWIDTCLTVKYTTNGIFRWARNYYNYGADEGYKIVSDQYGSVYAAVDGVVSYPVYLTVKYDRNGTQQWASIYYPPGNSASGIYGMAVDRNHNAVFVTGQSISNNISVAATIKYNATTGDSIWTIRDTGIYNGGGADDIKLDTTGNPYITGVTYNYPSYVPLDIMTVKYSSLGSRVWISTYNGPYNGWDGGVALGLDNQNNVYVLGTSQSSPTVSDYVTIKYNQLVGINPNSNELPGEFKLFQNFPNPFNGISKIKYQIAKTSLVSIGVFDILGREIENLVDRELKPGTYQVVFDGMNYASGVYFYKLISDGNIIDTKKLILLK